MTIYTILLVIAGLLHFVAFPERYKASRVVGYVYMFAGLLQILLGALFFYSDYFTLFVVMTLGLNTLYLVVWLISTSSIVKRNSSISPEPITFTVVLRKLLEVALVVLCLI